MTTKLTVAEKLYLAEAHIRKACEYKRNLTEYTSSLNKINEILKCDIGYVERVDLLNSVIRINKRSLLDSEKAMHHASRALTISTILRAQSA